MNLPNRLTILRILLIPFCVALALLNYNVLSCIIFVIACLTDFLDGYIARKKKIITNFGKFADPVADKILAISMMVVLLYRGDFPWWALLIVLVRELAVDGLRLVAVDQGIVIAAGNLGKIKTNLQFFTVISALLKLQSGITITLCIAMCLLTLISGVQYFLASKDLLNLNP